MRRGSRLRRCNNSSVNLASLSLQQVFVATKSVQSEGRHGCEPQPSAIAFFGSKVR